MFDIERISQFPNRNYTPYFPTARSASQPRPTLPSIYFPLQKDYHKRAQNLCSWQRMEKKAVLTFATWDSSGWSIAYLWMHCEGCWSSLCYLDSRYNTSEFSFNLVYIIRLGINCPNCFHGCIVARLISIVFWSDFHLIFNY